MSCCLSPRTICIEQYTDGEWVPSGEAVGLFTLNDAESLLVRVETPRGVPLVLAGETPAESEVRVVDCPAATAAGCCPVPREVCIVDGEGVARAVGVFDVTTEATTLLRVEDFNGVEIPDAVLAAPGACDCDSPAAAGSTESVSLGTKG